MSGGQAGPSSWWDEISEHWSVIFQAAAWTLNLILGFMLTPPVSNPETLQHQGFLRFGQFFIAAVLGLMFVATQRWKQKRYLKRWVWVAVISLILSTALFFTYQDLSNDWVCHWEGAAIVMGDRYTEVGENNAKRYGHSGCDQLSDFRGNAERIWTSDTLRYRRRLLAAMFLLSLPMLTICLISVAQAIRCSNTHT